MMVKRGWDCHVRGVGRPFSSAVTAIETLYAEDADVDDHVCPLVVAENGRPVGRIQDHDSVLFFNFRGDRAIEISQAFSESDFSGFSIDERPSVYFAGMMQYDGDTKMPAQFLVDPPAIDNTVGEYLVAANLRTYAVSETQKFGHVTFFFNGNRSGYIDSSREHYHRIIFRSIKNQR